MIGNSQVLMSDTVFYSNIGQFRGGAIMAESFGSLTLDTCFFISNYVRNDTGDSLYLSTSTSPVLITSTYFQHTILA